MLTSRVSHTQNPNHNKIDISNDEFTRHWAKKLAKSKEEIAAAIKKVGHNCAGRRRDSVGYVLITISSLLLDS